MNQISLDQLIVGSATSALNLQRSNGSMPPGHNGPWDDQETSVRNTAHWAISFYKAFKISKDERFIKAAGMCCDYLIAKENRPFGYTFICRTQESANNRSNGLIGQSWAVEALLALGEEYPKKGYWETANSVLSLHPYNFKKHSWSAVEIDGRLLSYHHIINQQIWFSFVAFWAGKQNPQLRLHAKDFFDNLLEKLEFLEPGLVRHAIGPSSFARRWIRQLRYNRSSPREAFLRELSIGYQPFLLHGLAKLEELFPGNLLGITGLPETIAAMIDYVTQTDPFLYGAHNSFAWSYNPVGIEMAFVLQIFGPKLKLKQASSMDPASWLNHQFQDHFDQKTQLLEKNTSDPKTLAARLYEATHLKDYSLSLG